MIEIVLTTAFNREDILVSLVVGDVPFILKSKLLVNVNPAFILITGDTALAMSIIAIVA